MRDYMLQKARVLAQADNNSLNLNVLAEETMTVLAVAGLAIGLT